MRLVIAWVRIIESEIYPMIPAPSNYEGRPRNGHNEGDEIPSLQKMSQRNLPGEAHWRVEEAVDIIFGRSLLLQFIVGNKDRHGGTLIDQCTHSH